jgi:hypothetical protein
MRPYEGYQLRGAVSKNAPLGVMALTCESGTQESGRGGSGGLRYPLNVTRHYRHLETLTIGFVVVLLISNLVGQKVCQFGWLRITGAEFLFPLTYIGGMCLPRYTGTEPRGGRFGWAFLPWVCWR